jgi:hypothetical protein
MTRVGSQRHRKKIRDTLLLSLPYCIHITTGGHTVVHFDNDTKHDMQFLYVTAGSACGYH